MTEHKTTNRRRNAVRVKPLVRLSQLREGTIVRNKASGLAWVVLANYGDRAVAVRETSIMNPSEWHIVEPNNAVTGSEAR